MSTTREIAPKRTLAAHTRSLWEDKELLGFLIWRDWRVRYRQTLIGATWAVLQPLILAAIFAVFLGRIVETNDGSMSYAYFVFTGMVPWLLFSQGTAQAADSLVSHADLIKKSGFSRFVLPIAAVGGFLPNFLVGTMVVGIWAFSSGLLRPASLLTLFSGVLTTLAALAVGIGLSALNVKYRDVRFATPFALQAWLFATPVIYPGSLLGETGQWILALNPMTGPVNLYRWSVGAGDVSALQTGISLGVSVLILLISTAYFSAVEDQMADAV